MKTTLNEGNQIQFYTVSEIFCHSILFRIRNRSGSAKAKSFGSDRIRIHTTAPPLPKKSSQLRFITTSPWSHALTKGARYADLEGENQLEVEGWIAGGRVNGTEAEVLAGVLGGSLAQDPAYNI
jgi:hypothetical protein